MVHDDAQQRKDELFLCQYSVSQRKKSVIVCVCAGGREGEIERH